jgi:hypothetical protein
VIGLLIMLALAAFLCGFIAGHERGQRQLGWGRRRRARRWRFPA